MNIFLQLLCGYESAKPVFLLELCLFSILIFRARWLEKTGLYF